MHPNLIAIIKSNKNLGFPQKSTSNLNMKKKFSASFLSQYFFPKKPEPFCSLLANLFRKSKL
jgi:hypothetical protein